MALNLQTDVAGTYIVTYLASDKATNTTTKTRNVYIKNSVGVPSITLTGDSNGKTKYMLNAEKQDTPLTTALPFSATDQYGNNVKYLVELEIKAYKHTGSSGGSNTFDETTIQVKVPYLNANFNLDQNREFLLLLENGNNGSRPALVNGDHIDYHTSSSSSVQASYFLFKYSLQVPGEALVEKSRIVYLVDFAQPSIIQSAASSNFDLNTSSDTVKSVVEAKFSASDNYWSGPESFWDIGSAINNGFSELTFVYRNAQGNQVNEIDTSVAGNNLFTCTATLTPNYTSVGNPTAKANWVNAGSQADSSNKVYTATHNISVNADTEDPVVTFVNYTNQFITGIGTLNSVGNDLYWTIPSSGTYNFDNLDLWRAEGSPALSEINVNDNDLANINSTHITVTYTKGSYSKDKNSRSDLGRDFTGLSHDNETGIASTIGKVGSGAQWTASYTVEDPSGNSTTVSRFIFIIDSLAPTITFDSNSANNTEYNTFGNGIVFPQYSNAQGAAQDTQSITQNTDAQYSDNFNDTSNQQSDPKVTLTKSSLYTAYPKNLPFTTYFLKYDSSNDHYEIYDFYKVRQNNDVNLATLTTIVFDFSHHDNISQTNFPNINLSSNTNFTLTNQTNSSAYSKPGNYHAYMSFNISINNPPLPLNLSDYLIFGNVNDPQPEHKFKLGAI